MHKDVNSFLFFFFSFLFSLSFKFNQPSELERNISVPKLQQDAQSTISPVT